MEGADIVLGRHVNARLAADASIDLTNERRRTRDPVETTAKRSRSKARDVCNSSAANRNDHIPALELDLREGTPEPLERGHVLDLLPTGQQQTRAKIRSAIRKRCVDHHEHAPIPDRLRNTRERARPHHGAITTRDGCDFDRRRCIDDRISGRGVESGPLVLQVGEPMQVDSQRTLPRPTVGLDSPPEHRCWRIQPEHARPRRQHAASAGPRQRTAAKSDDAMLAAHHQLDDHCLLELAKRLLAVAKEVGDRSRRTTLKLAVDVDEADVLELCQAPTNGALARAHEADEDVGARAHGAAGDQGMRAR